VEICGLALPGPGLEPIAGACKHGNRPSGSITDGEFLD
jgi:hypothetical protein